MDAACDRLVVVVQEMVHQQQSDWRCRRRRRRRQSVVGRNQLATESCLQNERRLTDSAHRLTADAAGSFVEAAFARTLSSLRLHQKHPHTTHNSYVCERLTHTFSLFFTLLSFPRLNAFKHHAD